MAVVAKPKEEEFVVKLQRCIIIIFINSTHNAQHITPQHTTTHHNTHHNITTLSVTILYNTQNPLYNMQNEFFL